MKKLLHSVPLLFFLILVLFTGKNHNSNSYFLNFPLPTEGEEHEKNRQLFFELMHRAAPGTNWRDIEFNNMLEMEGRLNSQSNRQLGITTDTFANGQLQGVWEERGSDNLAGRINGVAYDSVGDYLYSISNGGTLWKGTLTGNWQPLNQVWRFKQDVISFFKRPTGQNRILLAVNGTVRFTDDDAQTINMSSGITYPVAWGGNSIKAIVTTADPSHTVFCLVYAWDPAPWQPRFWLYRSTDFGNSFTKIYTFSHGDDGKVSMNRPYNSNEVYILDSKATPGAITLFQAGSTVSLVNTFSSTEADKRCLLKGTMINGNTTLYSLFDNLRLYKSANLGSNWTLQSTLPVNSWDRLALSMDDTSKVFFGGVEAYRSSNSGSSWTLVNSYGTYYSNPSANLHGDIQEITSFRKQNGSSFTITNSDGGSYVSYDYLLTNNNISLTTLRTGQFYDILTDQDQTTNLFGGSQDQGFQRNTTATAPGALNFTQVISGDYGDLVFSGNPKHLWTEYPGGVIYYYDNPLGGSATTWHMPGTQLPNAGWMMPITNTAFSTTANEVFMGGGNLNGDSGSYLTKLTANTTQPFAINGSQFNFNFRANSNNGTSGISAVEAAKNDGNRLYVATEDGTFFYSNDAGNSWTKTTNFSGPGPWFLYGSSIFSSRLTPSLLWYAGSGYSNPGVYKSTNGGQSFTALSNDLPLTLVYQVVANPSETMLFAATEAGPYVYIMAQNQWYPMTSTNPYQSYTTVEYIASSNIVRFGTYGRGIWDFKISNAPPSAPLISLSGPQVICSSGSVTLTSSIATGNQWYKDGVAIPGAINQSYQVTQGGSYTVTAVVGGVVSNPATPILITVNNLGPSAPSITAAGPATFCDGGNVTLTSSIANGNKWYRNGTLISGATGQNYQATLSGTYTATATTNNCESIPSNGISVTVNPIPPQPTITQIGSSLHSSASSGNQWYSTGLTISGATQQDYTPTSSGLYSVQVTSNNCIGPTSAPFNYIVAGVNTLSLQKKILFYPNPVEKYLTIEYKGNYHKMTATLFDLQGKKLMGGISFTNRISLNLEKLQAASYIVEVMDLQTKQYVRKEIVKR